MNLHRDTHNVQKSFEQLPAIAKWLTKEIGLAAADLNMSAYLVGGPVRDLLLNIPNLDLDYVVENSAKGSTKDLAKKSAIELAHHLCQKYPDKIVAGAEHERFQTARIIVQDLKVDLSTARTETYEHPAALPIVEASTLSADLIRRDFTINALAACANPDRWGELVDCFNGLDDLKAKTIRILHPASFIDDPTRIIRAARFAGRLNFKLDPDTKDKAQAALATGIFNDLGGVRVKTEIISILNMPARIKALDLLGSLSETMCYLDAHLKYDSTVKKNLRCAERVLARYPLPQEAWIVYLGVLVAALDLQRLENLFARLQLDSDARNHIREGIALSKRLEDLKRDSKPSEIYHAVHNASHDVSHGISDYSLAIAACLGQPGSIARRAIRSYMERLKDIEPSLSGDDLLKMGMPEGPIIGHALTQLKDELLDGILKSRNDEMGFIKTHFLTATTKGA
jgi:tRNA nucleotidyltransferase (CCA-adding enzyme)